MLSQSAAVDVAEYHKKTVKELRIWNWNDGEIENALGGRAVYLGHAALLNMTGAPSVSPKATPDPCLLVGRESTDIRRVAHAVYSLGQHNYLSPNVPYRDAQPMRDADHALQQKVAMEVRGLR